MRGALYIELRPLWIDDFTSRAPSGNAILKMSSCMLYAEDKASTSSCHSVSNLSPARGGGYFMMRTPRRNSIEAIYRRLHNRLVRCALPGARLSGRRRTALDCNSLRPALHVHHPYAQLSHVCHFHQTP